MKEGVFVGSVFPYRAFCTDIKEMFLGFEDLKVLVIGGVKWKVGGRWTKK